MIKHFARSRFWQIGAVCLLILHTACAETTVLNTTEEERSQWETAVFAGGCFWCMVGPFERRDGVHEVLSGFNGGTEVDPSYMDVVRGRTNHVEAVEIYYDPKIISFEELLSIYWSQIDPTDEDGQFADRGAHYRPVLFVQNDEERRIAAASRETLAQSGRFPGSIVVTIEDRGPFYLAPAEHQYYYRTQPSRYNRYFQGSGRKAFLDQFWSSSNTSNPPSTTK